MSQLTYDYFVAPLRCPRCGAVSADDDSTAMQTYIRRDPSLAWLRIGDALTVEPEAMRERGYLPVRPPDGPILLVQDWSCPSCHASPNWAEIVIDQRRIVCIESVVLSREVLARAHYLQDEIRGLAAALVDRSFADVSDEEIIPILERLL